MLHVEKVATHYGQVKALHEVSLIWKKGNSCPSGFERCRKIDTPENHFRPQPGIFGSDPFWRPRYFEHAAHKITALGMAMVPEGRQVYPMLTVEENLEIGAYSLKDASLKPKLLEQVLKEFPASGNELVNLPAL